MSLSFPVYYLVPLVIACLFVLRKRQRPRYPPGPKGLPLVGNLLDVPTEYSWLAYGDMARQCGSEIIHLETLGTHIVILSSAKATKELFEKRSSIYSDRQHSHMMELSGWRRLWALMPYDDLWREHRRLFHQHFRPLAVPQYHASQAKGIRRLLQLLLDKPEKFDEHVRYAAGSTILDIVYALDVLPGDPLIDVVEKAVHSAADIINAGVYLVEVFPMLKHLPLWFPGAQFRRQAAKWRTWVSDMYEVPYAHFKAAMDEGRAKPCFAATLMSTVEASEDMQKLEDIFIGLTGTSYAAGSDTTVITLTSFILAMVLHPKVQVFVQEELDRVIGRDRLPGIEDQQFLPRVTAVVHEVLRWHPALPMALPHRTTADDEYSGYHIPKGSVVMGNSWAILHDEEVYPDPYSFNPKRYLTGGGVLRDDVPFPIEAFGYSRRICPGRYFAQDILFLAVSNLLAIFTIEKAVDKNGRAIEVVEGFTPRILSWPEPFKAHFQPRFHSAEDLIRSSVLMD